MKIIVPMAGRGKRFLDHGTSTPKQLISVAGHPMIFWAIQSLKHISCEEIIFIALQEHEHQHGIKKLILSFDLPGPPQFIFLPDVTEGQLCTVLEAREWIASDEDILIASSDTYVISNLGKDILEMSKDSHGLISVASAPGDHWSFARTDKDGRVVEVAEKRRISNFASTGLYYFSKWSELVETAEAMIRANEKTRGEYFVVPVYQKFIQRGWRVVISFASQMWDMGNPEALSIFTDYLTRKIS